MELARSHWRCYEGGEDESRQAQIYTANSRMVPSGGSALDIARHHREAWGASKAEHQLGAEDELR